MSERKVWQHPVPGKVSGCRTAGGGQYHRHFHHEQARDGDTMCRSEGPVADRSNCSRPENEWTYRPRQQIVRIDRPDGDKAGCGRAYAHDRTVRGGTKVSLADPSLTVKIYNPWYVQPSEGYDGGVGPRPCHSGTKIRLVQDVPGQDYQRGR